MTASSNRGPFPAVIHPSPTVIHVFAAVIVSAAKNPGAAPTTHTVRTFLPQRRKSAAPQISGHPSRPGAPSVRLYRMGGFLILLLAFVFPSTSHAQPTFLNLTVQDTVQPLTPVLTDPPSPRHSLLTRLADPNLAVLLVIVGALLIYLEFNLPGTIFPGALGILCVLLGAFALSRLPLSHPALAALFAAMVMILLELKYSTHGLLAGAGTLCLIYGLANLIDSPIPELRVHLSTAIACGLGFGSISFFLAWIALRARRNKVLTGPAAMLRQIATVVTPLAPTGHVEVRGELWQARLTDPTATLAPGARAHVDAIDGLTLLVHPVATLSIYSTKCYN